MILATVICLSRSDHHPCLMGTLSQRWNLLLNLPPDTTKLKLSKTEIAQGRTCRFSDFQFEISEIKVEFFVELMKRKTMQQEKRCRCLLLSSLLIRTTYFRILELTFSSTTKLLIRVLIISKSDIGVARIPECGEAYRNAQVFMWKKS